MIFLINSINATILCVAMRGDTWQLLVISSGWCVGGRVSERQYSTRVSRRWCRVLQRSDTVLVLQRPLAESHQLLHFRTYPVAYIGGGVFPPPFLPWQGRGTSHVRGKNDKKTWIFISMWVKSRENPFLGGFMGQILGKMPLKSFALCWVGHILGLPPPPFEKIYIPTPLNLPNIFVIGNYSRIQVVGIL